MSTPEPIATGTLAKTPLPHLLVYLEQKKLSGTLVVWPEPSDEGEPDGAPDRVLMLKGVPVAGKLIAPTTSLRDGLLSLFARTRAPYAFYESNLLGDDRLSGRIDPFALIAAALRVGAQDSTVDEVLQRFGLVPLRLLPGVELARYELQPEERAFVDQLRSQAMDVAALMREGGVGPERGRRLVYLMAITKAVAPADRAPARAASMAAVPPPPPPAGAAGPAEPAVAAPPPAPPPPSPAPPSPPAAEAAAPMVVTSPPTALAPGPTLSQAPPQPLPANAASNSGGMHSSLDRLHSIPPPPEGLPEELHNRWLRVIAKGRLVENQNHFEMLDVDKEVKSSDARSKFYQLAKEWHPDRLPQELQPLQEYVRIIFSYMSDAGATLGDETQRVQYLQSVREGGGTPATERMMQSILDTAMQYERVLVMARKHEYDDAIVLILKILATVNDEPDYHAMYASLLLQKYPGQDAPLQKMLDAVNRAISLHEKHERANMLKGQILRRMGKPTEALEYFRLVAEINPRNIDAMREVRVATMRSTSMAPKPGKGRGRTKKPEPTGVAGLFGKLFKKD